MIVYGNQHYEIMLSTLVLQLRARVEAVLRASDGAQIGVGRLRALLILSGELEQAAHDALIDLSPDGDAEKRISRLHHVTACAARAFYSAYALENPGAPAARISARAALAEMFRASDEICFAPDMRVTVRTPEGFAFYALYPEQYAAAALRWSLDHASDRYGRVLVIGIRTIGTTLAATVAAALDAAGWQVHSFTVRPSGNAFARQVELPPSQIDGAEWGLVVDEGPGLSGSSMASVGEALVRAGMPRSRISFFPGHGGQPGNAGSETVRGWWATTPRYTASIEDALFNGRSLVGALSQSASELCSDNDPVVKAEDFGGGMWRNALYTDPAMWPPVCARFEQPKYRLTTRGGRRFFFKFAGLNSAPGGGETMAGLAATRMAERAATGWGVAPLRVADGFIASEWVEGSALARADCDSRLLALVGRYAAEVAGPPLSESQRERGAARLTDMLYWNVREALGESAAEPLLRLRDGLMRLAMAAGSRSYGDGRLSPHEWLRTPAGKIVKADTTGHELDHTIVGAQPVAWDLAGAIVEWGSDARAAAALLNAYHYAGGDLMPTGALDFYCLAYAAFRAGQFKLCMDAADDSSERTRSRRAYYSFRGELERRLNGIQMVRADDGSHERATPQAIYF